MLCGFGRSGRFRAVVLRSCGQPAGRPAADATSTPKPARKISAQRRRRCGPPRLSRCAARAGARNMPQCSLSCRPVSQPFLFPVSGPRAKGRAQGWFPRAVYFPSSAVGRAVQKAPGSLDAQPKQGRETCRNVLSPVALFRSHSSFRFPAHAQKGARRDGFQGPSISPLPQLEERFKRPPALSMRSQSRGTKHAAKPSPLRCHSSFHARTKGHTQGWIPGDGHSSSPQLKYRFKRHCPGALQPCASSACKCSTRRRMRSRAWLSTNSFSSCVCCSSPIRETNWLTFNPSASCISRSLPRGDTR